MYVCISYQNHQNEVIKNCKYLVSKIKVKNLSANYWKYQFKRNNYYYWHFLIAPIFETLYFLKLCPYVTNWSIFNVKPLMWRTICCSLFSMTSCIQILYEVAIRKTTYFPNWKFLELYLIIGNWRKLAILKSVLIRYFTIKIQLKYWSNWLQFELFQIELLQQIQIGATFSHIFLAILPSLKSCFSQKKYFKVYFPFLGQNSYRMSAMHWIIFDTGTILDSAEFKNLRHLYQE